MWKDVFNKTRKLQPQERKMHRYDRIKIKDFFSIKVAIDKINNTWQVINIKAIQENPCISLRKR